MADSNKSPKNNDRIRIRSELDDSSDEDDRMIIPSKSNKSPKNNDLIDLTSKIEDLPVKDDIEVTIQGTHSDEIRKKEMEALCKYLSKRMGVSKTKVDDCVREVIAKYSEYPQKSVEVVLLGLRELPDMLTSQEKKILDTYQKQQPLLKITRDGSTYHIPYENFERLLPDEWLEDLVIHSYIELCQDISLMKIKVIDSQAYQRWFRQEKYDYSKLQRGKKYWGSIFNYELILFPLNYSSHWVLAVIYITDMSIKIYDSLYYTTKNNKALLNLKKFVRDEYAHLSEENASNAGEYMKQWTTEIVKDARKQVGGFDCGVFLCQHARCIILSKPFDFGQANIQYIRQKMQIDLINGYIGMY